mmetsp:Transcript_45476/g.89577  ORF Transcript_45476/g.89577 Transcript_45476/m.89577 type:complete len:93 (+) Transcript_45476:783-1061(+)
MPYVRLCDEKENKTNVVRLVVDAFILLSAEGGAVVDFFDLRKGFYANIILPVDAFVFISVRSVPLTLCICASVCLCMCVCSCMIEEQNDKSG